MQHSDQVINAGPCRNDKLFLSMSDLNPASSYRSTAGAAGDDEKPKTIVDTSRLLLLGRGRNMVYALDNHRALKVFTHLAPTTLTFDAEVRAIRRLTGHGITADFIDAWTVDDAHTTMTGYIVMQRLYGSGLEPRAVDRRLAMQVCDCLSIAHALGVGSRDLHPNNVVVQPNGTVRLIDWGQFYYLIERKHPITYGRSRFDNSMNHDYLYLWWCLQQRGCTSKEAEAVFHSFVDKENDKVTSA